MKKAPTIVVIVAAAFLTIISTNHVAWAQKNPNGVPPAQVTNTYAAKFICGVQKDGAVTSIPEAQAGRYSSKINVHNNTGVTITFRKKIINLTGGGQKKIEPVRLDPESLRPDWAMEVVCRDIYNHLQAVPPPGDAPRYIEGFVIFEVLQPFHTPTPPPDPLDVEGIYTYRGDIPNNNTVVNNGVSIAVVVYPAKSNIHPLQ
jgi:hypothetical protein